MPGSSSTIRIDAIGFSLPSAAARSGIRPPPSAGWRVRSLDATAVQFDDAAGDRQAEAGAGRAGREEWIEHPLLVSGREAWSEVSDREDQAAVLQGRPCPRGAIGRRGLRGVAEQVDEHGLPEASLVQRPAIGRPRPRRRPLDLDRAVGELRRGRAQQRRRIDRPQVDRPRPHEVEQVGGEHLESGRLLDDPCRLAALDRVVREPLGRDLERSRIRLAAAREHAAGERHPGGVA